MAIGTISARFAGYLVIEDVDTYYKRRFTGHDGVIKEAAGAAEIVRLKVDIIVTTGPIVNNRDGTMLHCKRWPQIFSMCGVVRVRYVSFIAPLGKEPGPPH
jgi:hypothetical protein